MNKMEFFKILEEGLIDFPAHELQEILYDYKEHFSNAQSDGKTEEEIIEELGDPYTIVNQYRSNYIQVSTTNTELATVLGLGTGLLAIPFAFSISGILMLLGKFGFTILGFGVPAFFADFPTSVTLLITIGSISATLICFILLIYLIKFIILIIKKLMNKLSNKEGI